MYSNGPTNFGGSVYTITYGTSGATATDSNLNYPLTTNPWTTISDKIWRSVEDLSRALRPFAEEVKKAIDKVIEAFKKTAVYRKLHTLTMKQRWLRQDLPIFAERQIQLLREVAPIERPTFRRRVCALSSSYRVRV